VRVVGRLLLVGLLALLMLAATPGSAGAQRNGDPAELSEELPLDLSPTPASTAASAAATPEGARAPARDAGPITISTVSLMILAAGLGAMAVTLARGGARARAARAPEPVAAERPVADARAITPRAVDVPAAEPPPVAERRARRRRPAFKRPALKLPEARPRAVKAPSVEAPSGEPRPGTAHAPKAPAAESSAARPPAAPAPARPSERAPAPATQPGVQSCRIRLWHGYIKKQFYAESPETGELVAKSAFFRVEKGSTIQDSSNAAEAFDALVDELAGDGWEITGREPGSWDVALRRRAGAPRQPVK
jgi:hypothetical protein